MTKLMHILSSIPSGLEFWWINHTSIYRNSESNVFKNIKFLGEISNNSPNDLLERLLNLADNCCWQYYNRIILLQ